MEINSGLIYDLVFTFLVATVTFFILHFKNNPTSLRKVFEYSYMMKLISGYLPIVAVLGIVAPTILGLYNFSILGLYIAIPMFFGPIIFSRVFKNRTEDDLMLYEE